MKNKEFYDKLYDVFENVIKRHEQGEMRLTTDEEQDVMNMINEAINEGDIEMYPMKALLTACNDWSTMNIVRISFYREILLEGVEAGALAPENEFSWHWVRLATINNDAEELFQDDIERYYNLMMDAAENGRGYQSQSANRKPCRCIKGCRHFCWCIRSRYCDPGNGCFHE